MPKFNITPALINHISSHAQEAGQFEYKYAYAYYVTFQLQNPSDDELNNAIVYFKEIASSQCKQKYDACIALGNLALRKLPASVQNISLEEANKFLMMPIIASYTLQVDTAFSYASQIGKACFVLANLYRQQSTNNFDANDIIALVYYFIASLHLKQAPYHKLIHEELLLAQQNNPNLINNLSKLVCIKSHYHDINLQFNSILEADLFYKVIRCLQDMKYFSNDEYISALGILKNNSKIGEHLKAKIDFQLAKTYLIMANLYQSIDYARDSISYAQQITSNEGTRATSKAKKAQKLIDTLSPLFNQKTNSGFVEPSYKIISTSKNIFGTIMRWVGNIIGSALESLVIWLPKWCHFVDNLSLPVEKQDKDLSFLNSGIGYAFGAVTRYIGYGIGIGIGAAISLCAYPFRAAVEEIDFKFNKESILTEQTTKKCLTLTDTDINTGFIKEKNEKNHNPNLSGRLFNKSTYGNYKNTLFFKDPNSNKPEKAPVDVNDLIQSPTMFEQNIKSSK